MKMIKLALLGGAALAVTAVSAQADELTDLKAQLETLNNRVAQLEAAPQVPAGYNLMSISEADATVIPGLRDHAQDKGYGDKATFISILPTADAAPATTIEWSGYVRNNLGYSDNADNIYDNARGQLKVVGKTDTAVGEVGVVIQLRADAFAHDVKSPFVSNEAWGWWKFAPGMTLGAGYTGSLGNVGYGLDGACSCYGTDNGDAADLNPGDAEQLRLSWESGPVTFAMAVEDSDFTNGGRTDNDLAFAGEVKYAGDSFSGELSGWYDPNGPDQYMIGIGTSIALGDMAALSLGAQLGQDNYATIGNDYWAISALASINLSDEVYAELGYAYKDRDSGVPNSQDAIVGIYYQPVDQLTLGLEGEWYTQAQAARNANGKFRAAEDTIVNFVSVFRF